MVIHEPRRGPIPSYAHTFLMSCWRKNPQGVENKLATRSRAEDRQSLEMQQSHLSVDIGNSGSRNVSEVSDIFGSVLKKSLFLMNSHFHTCIEEYCVKHLAFLAICFVDQKTLKVYMDLKKNPEHISKSIQSILTGKRHYIVEQELSFKKDDAGNVQLIQ